MTDNDQLAVFWQSVTLMIFVTRRICFEAVALIVAER